MEITEHCYPTKKQNELIDLKKTSVECIIDLMNIFTQQHNDLIKIKENSIVSKYNDTIEIEKIRLQYKQADVEIKKLEVNVELKK